MKISIKAFLIIFLLFTVKNINGQDVLGKTGYMIYSPELSPFGASYYFSLAIPDTSNVKVYIVNGKANIIKNIYDGIVVDRLTRFAWDTKNNEDSFVKSGVYYFVVEATLKTSSLVDMYYKILFSYLYS